MTGSIVDEASSGRQGRDTVSCYTHGDVRIERYLCNSNERRSVDRHSHEEYQFGLSSTDAAAYRYRGSEHRVGPSALSVIDTGEPHDTYELERIPEPVIYDITYIAPSVLLDISAMLPGSPGGMPSFSQPVLIDARLLRLWHLYRSSVGGEELERDSRLLFVIVDLLRRFTRNKTRELSMQRSDQAISRVRDYLHDHHSEKIQLSQLADVAGLTAAHLCTLFNQRFGMPPHQFQLHVRIDRAKHLLARRMPAARVAIDLGFTHQSHFGRHFKRLVGVAPGAYVGR